MDGYRIGRVVRALRHTRNWTQRDLGRRSGCHGSVISRLERGNLRACSLTRLALILDQLDARLTVSVQWRGGELDRLLDADHARLGERWAHIRPPRWVSRAEVTYNHFGDRGSIDVLAFDAVSGTLLVTELKTGVYDAQRAVAKLDEKARVASSVARRFGWVVRRVTPALVLAEGRTNRTRASMRRCSRGSTAAVGPRRLGFATQLGRRSTACCCSLRCQMCAGRTVGEPGARECGPHARSRAWRRSPRRSRGLADAPSVTSESIVRTVRDPSGRS